MGKKTTVTGKLTKNVRAAKGRKVATKVRPDARDITRIRIPEVYFGAVSNKKRDWRSVLLDPLFERDDDEKFDETPADVIARLGFDPKEPDDDPSEAPTRKKIKRSRSEREREK